MENANNPDFNPARGQPASTGYAAAWSVAPAYWPEKDWPRTVTLEILGETVAEAVRVSPIYEALVKPHTG